jgi:hypothetical protein
MFPKRNTNVKYLVIYDIFTKKVRMKKEVNIFPKTEETREEAIGKTLGIYRELAIALNRFPKGQPLSIREFADQTNVHYNTAKKALLFFHLIDSVMPKFQMQEGEFRVISKPNALEAVEGLFESREMRILTKMMLLNAVDAEKAQKFDDILTNEERPILSQLIERGFVNCIEGRYYLSSQGQSLGSMGLSKIVKLNIPLPWENRATPVYAKTSSQISQTCAEMMNLFNMKCSKSWIAGSYQKNQMQKDLSYNKRKEGRFVNAII